MTLAELVETNGHISLIRATVRGTAQSEYQYVSEYRVGTRAEYFRGDIRGADKDGCSIYDSRIKLVNKPIHVRDDGAASYEFGQIMKNIPKEIARLEVSRWRCHTEYGCNWHNGERGDELTCDIVSDEFVRLMAKQKKIEAVKRSGEEGQQLTLEVEP